MKTAATKLKGLLGRVFALNPVTLKELRQLVRTKVIIAAMVVYPIVLFAITSAVISASLNDAEKAARPVQSVTMGGPILGVSAAILGLVACIVLPVYSGIRLAKESVKGRADLQFITALRPVDVAGGKIAATMLVALVFAGITAPFMTFAYMLHGVTLVAITSSLAGVLLTAVASAAFAVMLGASTQVSVGMRIARLVVVYGIGAFYFLVMGCVFAFESNHLYIGLSHVGLGVALVVLLVAMWAYFARACAAAALTPMHADYNGPLRRVEVVSVTVVSLILVAAAACGADSSVCGLFVAGALGAAMCGWRAMFTPPGMTRVCAAKAPRSLLGRLLKFPLASSAESGVVFSVLLACAIVGACCAACAAGGYGYDFPKLAAIAYAELMLPPFLLAVAFKAFRVRPAVYRYGVAISLIWVALMMSSGILEAMDAIDSCTTVFGNPYAIFCKKEMELHVAYAMLSATLLVPMAVAFAIPAFHSYRRRAA